MLPAECPCQAAAKSSGSGRDEHWSHYPFKEERYIRRKEDPEVIQWCLRHPKGENAHLTYTFLLVKYRSERFVNTGGEAHILEAQEHVLVKRIRVEQERLVCNIVAEVYKLEFQSFPLHALCF